VFLPDSVSASRGDRGSSPTVRQGVARKNALAYARATAPAHPRNGSGYDQAARDRATAPIDELREYERTRTPLLSLESHTPVRDFDVVAFSISFETDYINMARMMQMSGVPVWAKDRTKHDPLIVMGGASSFLNPEPIADFTDVIGVGEGEILGPKLVDVILENGSKEEILAALARQGRGFYVPSFYDVSYNYWPPRVVPARDILAKARAWRSKTDKIGLVSTAVCDHPEISEILQGLRAMDYRISVSSLRLDQISDELLDALVESRDQQIAV